MVERGENVLFYFFFLYIDRKKIFRQPEPEFARIICINRQDVIHWSVPLIGTHSQNDVNISHFELFDVIVTFQHAN